MGYQRNIKTEIPIQSAEELSGTLRSDVVYKIDGLIDMGSIEMVAPPGGLFFLGTDYFKSGLYSTADNYTMFKTAAGVPTSNIRIQELNFWASGVSSKLFDLDGTGNFGAIEFNSCNLGDFTGQTTEIGELTSFRQFRTNDAGFFRAADGLTFSGAWSGGFRIGDSIALATVGTMTLFKEGTGLTFGGRCVSDGNFSSLNDNTTVFDFQESNFIEDASFQLDTASFNRNADPVPNISSSSTKAFFKNCTGIDNTHVRALVTSTTQVINTLTQDTPEKVEGASALTYGTWMSSPVSNRITIDTEIEMDVEVSYRCRIDAGPNDELAIAINHYNSAGTLLNEVVREIRLVANAVSGFDVVDFDVDGVVSNTNLGDYFEPTIENTSDDTDATVQIGAKLKAVRI